MENNLKFYISKLRMAKLILISMLILVIGIFGIKSEFSLFYVIGLINFFIGFLGILVGVYNLIKDKPILIINNEGIAHKKITKKPIPWDIIHEAKLINVKNQKILSIKKVDNSKFSDFKYLFKKTSNLSEENGIINLNIDQLNVDENILFKYLNEKIEKTYGNRS